MGFVPYGRGRRRMSAWAPDSPIARRRWSKRPSTGKPTSRSTRRCSSRYLWRSGRLCLWTRRPSPSRIRSTRTLTRPRPASSASRTSRSRCVTAQNCTATSSVRLPAVPTSRCLRSWHGPTTASAPTSTAQARMSASRRACPRAQSRRWQNSRRLTLHTGAATAMRSSTSTSEVLAIPTATMTSSDSRTVRTATTSSSGLPSSLGATARWRCPDPRRLPSASGISRRNSRRILLASLRGKA